MLKDDYGAPLETLNFLKGADGARKHINSWVADQTRQRILDLIPEDAVNGDTRLVLVNAIYLKASWESEFDKDATRPGPFHVRKSERIEVPTMSDKIYSGYRKSAGYIAISLPYVGSDLEFLILLPDDVDGLPALEKKLTAGMLGLCKLKRPMSYVSS